LTLTVSVGEFEKYVEAWIRAAVVKNADITVDLLTKNVNFAEVRPRILLTERAHLKEVAKAVQHGAGWKAAVVGGLGGMATRNVTAHQSGGFQGTYNDRNGYGTVTGSYSGRSTVQEPDTEARTNARARAREIIREGQSRSAGVMSTALLDTTVGPGQAVSGFVYFRREKVMRSGVLQIRVGTVSFEFPFEWQ
jgi:hypothetical protein